MDVDMLFLLWATEATGTAVSVTSKIDEGELNSGVPLNAVIRYSYTSPTDCSPSSFRSYTVVSPCVSVW